MEISKLSEHGYEWACMGLGLSFKDRALSIEEWWTPEKFKNMQQVLKVNAPRNKGHNKALEHIVIYLLVEAPRYFWSEFDTYRVGVSKQSESTMHTLAKRDMIGGDLEAASYDGKYNKYVVDLFNKVKNAGAAIPDLKKYLPESYLQRREVVLNYKVLAHIIIQRHSHRLPEWRYFIKEIYKLVSHPELLPDLGKLRIKD
jgi:thymidylate synthase ThyX